MSGLARTQPGQVWVIGTEAMFILAHLPIQDEVADLRHYSGPDWRSTGQRQRLEPDTACNPGACRFQPLELTASTALGCLAVPSLANACRRLWPRAVAITARPLDLDSCKVCYRSAKPFRSTYASFGTCMVRAEARMRSHDIETLMGRSWLGMGMAWLGRETRSRGKPAALHFKSHHHRV